MRLVSVSKFQSTPPREGRLYRTAYRWRAGSFNPRPHARGDVIIYDSIERQVSFNPRPHARGDVLFLSCNISVVMVSIHAPTRGATRCPCAWWKLDLRFNPRPHARGDSGNGNIDFECRVSIHAPTRGATRKRHVIRRSSSFNPRPHARGDHDISGKWYA